MALEAPFDPVEVSDLDLAFPARALEFMPRWNAIPGRYKHINPWSGLFATWAFQGLKSDVEFHMVTGIDGLTAHRHLKAIMGSFAPKHEHKEATFCFLASLWFTKVVNGDTVYMDHAARRT